VAAVGYNTFDDALDNVWNNLPEETRNEIVAASWRLTYSDFQQHLHFDLCTLAPGVIVNKYRDKTMVRTTSL
jgi:hypothetical protein